MLYSYDENNTFCHPRLENDNTICPDNKHIRFAQRVAPQINYILINTHHDRYTAADGEHTISIYNN